MMALTPEEMAEVEAQLKTRMGVKPPAADAEMVPGAKPAIDPTPTLREGELGAMEGGGGMGFGGINAAKQQAPQETPFDPNAGFKFDPAAGTEGGGAMGGLAKGLMGSLSMAKALRGKGKEPFGGIKDLFSTEQQPETTPLAD